MWTFILDMLLLSVNFFLRNCPLLIPLYNTAVLINICCFFINVAKLGKPYVYVCIMMRDNVTYEGSKHNQKV